MRPLTFTIAATSVFCAATAVALFTSPAAGEYLGLDLKVKAHDYIEGYGPALVVQVYAAFDNPEDSLQVVFGNEPYPLAIETATGEFFQHQLGGNTADSQLPALIELFPELCFDTFYDIGRTRSDQGGHLVGGEWHPIFTPTTLASDACSWGRIWDDPLTYAGDDGHVFFLQLTVPREAPALTGQVNLSVRADDSIFGVFGAEFSVCAGDANQDRTVNVDDLIRVITDWGTCPKTPYHCDADLNFDGQIDVNDLVEVIVNWNGGC